MVLGQKFAVTVSSVSEKRAKIPTPSSCLSAAPLHPPGVGWCLYPPAPLGAIGGALRAAVVYLCGEPENVWLVWPDSGVSL